MTLQEQVEAFVHEFQPFKPGRRYRFIEDLRRLMNAYAQEAIEHGQVPDAATHVCRQENGVSKP